MIEYLVQGFILGIAYVAPIGMQNLYVINTAIGSNKLKAYKVALTTIFFDVSLALACFFGMGGLMEKFRTLKLIILFTGCIAVVYIGIQLIRSTPETKNEVNANKSFSQIILTS